jgi:hypothetical protein
MGIMSEHDPNAMPDGPADVAEDIYAVVLPVSNTADHRSSLPPVIAQVVDEDDAFGSVKTAPFQFTLADLFILTTAIALIVGIVSLFAWHWQYAAGLAGVGAFISVVVLTTYEPENTTVRAACWTTLVFYVLACMAAIVTGR